MKFRFAIIFFLSALLFPVKAQDHLSIQFGYANNLFNSKLYFDAITEYKRLQFFDSTKTFNYEINYKIGENFTNNFSQIQIIEQIRMPQGKYTQKGYKYKCLKCGNED